jgi:hypothetical protein
LLEALEEEALPAVEEEALPAAEEALPAVEAAPVDTEALEVLAAVEAPVDKEAYPAQAGAAARLRHLRSFPRLCSHSQHSRHSRRSRSQSNDDYGRATLFAQVRSRQLFYQQLIYTWSVNNNTCQHLSSRKFFLPHVDPLQLHDLEVPRDAHHPEDETRGPSSAVAV